jgi:hypothetical protein
MSKKTPEKVDELPPKRNLSREKFEVHIGALLEGPYDQLLEAVQSLNSAIAVEIAGQLSGSDGKPWQELGERVFGNPSKYFSEGDSGLFEFGASRMDGADIDVFEVGGLPWTDDINDGVWGNTNWEELFSCCPEVNFEEEETIDEVPGQSDTYFTVSISQPTTIREGA